MGQASLIETVFRSNRRKFSQKLKLNEYFKIINAKDGFIFWHSINFSDLPIQIISFLCGNISANNRGVR